MKTLKTTIAILVLAITSNASFAQNAVYNAKNVLESNVAKHTCTKEVATAAALKVCPMQLAEGIVVLKLTNQPEGNYTVKIADENGTVIMTQVINHADAAAETVNFGKSLAGGTYTVEVVRPDNTVKTETILLWL